MIEKSHPVLSTPHPTTQNRVGRATFTENFVVVTTDFP